MGAANYNYKFYNIHKALLNKYNKKYPLKKKSAVKRPGRR